MQDTHLFQNGAEQVEKHEEQDLYTNRARRHGEQECILNLLEALLNHAVSCNR